MNTKKCVKGTMIVTVLCVMPFISGCDYQTWGTLVSNVSQPSNTYTERAAAGYVGMEPDPSDTAGLATESTRVAETLPPSSPPPSQPPCPGGDC